MKRIIIAEDIRVPGTNLTLEKGDQILVVDKALLEGIQKYLKERELSEQTITVIPRNFHTMDAATWNSFSGATELAPGIPPLVYEGEAFTPGGDDLHNVSIIISGDEGTYGKGFTIEVYWCEEAPGRVEMHGWAKHYKGWSSLWLDLKQRFKMGRFNIEGFVKILGSDD